MVFEHRAVMYDLHGAGIHPCFWCREPLDWPDIVIDHLNEIKDDNRPENLVVACNDCNRARGAMMPFIRRLSGPKFARLVEVLTAVRGE